MYHDHTYPFPPRHLPGLLPFPTPIPLSPHSLLSRSPPPPMQMAIAAGGEHRGHVMSEDISQLSSSSSRMLPETWLGMRMLRRPI